MRTVPLHSWSAPQRPPTSSCATSPKRSSTTGTIPTNGADPTPTRLLLLCGGPAALAAGLLLLRRRTALRSLGFSRARPALLAAFLGGARRVGDLGRALLRHALV